MVLLRSMLLPFVITSIPLLQAVRISAVRISNTNNPLKKDAPVAEEEDGADVVSVTISGYAKSRFEYEYRAVITGEGLETQDLSLTRSGPEGGTVMTLAAAGKSVKAEDSFEVLSIPEHEAYFVREKKYGESPCPKECEICYPYKEQSHSQWATGTMKKWEIKCKMPIDMSNTKKGTLKTCGGTAGGHACETACMATSKNLPGSEWCYTQKTGMFGNSLWGYCRCGEQDAVEAQLKDTLPDFSCRKVHVSDRDPGYLSAVCHKTKLYLFMADRKAKDKNASRDTWSVMDFGAASSTTKLEDAEPIYSLESPTDYGYELMKTFKNRTDENCEYAKVWDRRCLKHRSCDRAISAERWLDPVMKDGLITHNWQIDIPCPTEGGDYAWHKSSLTRRRRTNSTSRVSSHECFTTRVQPVLVLSIVHNLEALKLAVPEVALENISSQTVELDFPEDKDKFCGEKPEQKVQYGKEISGEWLRKPCVSSMFNTGCRCNLAQVLESGKKHPWCYVEDCNECGTPDDPNGTQVCHKPSSSFKSAVSHPWTYCYGDGYSPNRPINGVCPLLHECTGRPWRGFTEDAQVLKLKESIGRTIEGETTHVFQQMLGQDQRERERHRVDYTWCLPLGEYSRWVWTDLHVPGKDNVTVRHDIPVNEKAFGFSTDFFYALDITDLHLKLDVQAYSAFDASYIDGVIWFDMLQPYGNRETFPVNIPFVHVQRRFKTCLGQDVFKSLTEAITGWNTFVPNMRICVAYTNDRQVYVSFTFTLLGITLPLSKELHLATVHTREEGEESVVAGFTTGDLAFTNLNVTYDMHEMRERSTWDLTKMIVQLDRNMQKDEERIERLEKVVGLANGTAVL